MPVYYPGFWQQVTLVDDQGNPLSNLPQLSIQATLNAVAPIIAAAGDYGANDVLSQAVADGTGLPFVFAGASRAAGNGGWITRCKLDLSVDALVWRPRVHFFNAAPTTTEMDDNAVFNLTAADRLKYIGFLDLPALADFGAISVSLNATDRLPYTCAATSLYAILQTLDAFTNEAAAMTAMLEIQVERS